MIDLTNGLPELSNAKEGFKYNGKHTREYDMRLVERNAPTPTEKRITENLPFMQGEYDFSMILGGRVYNNRPLTFKFELLNRYYTNRKSIQTSIENWLMNSGYTPLYDDHAEGYRYIAKCIGVSVSDTYGGLTIDIEFDAYPFKISEIKEGNDLWDPFNFELDVAQVTEFAVNGTEEITLYNVGSNLLQPTIKTTAPMTITKDGRTYNVPQGQTKSHEFTLNVGENKLTIQGNGKIEFLFYKELI